MGVLPENHVLRPRCERPRGRRAAECGQQLPPSDGDFHTTQQLVLVEKNGNGKVTTKEILQVLFSQLEDTEPGTTSN